jgi:hypothetical protein
MMSPVLMLYTPSSPSLVKFPLNNLMSFFPLKGTNNNHRPHLLASNQKSLACHQSSTMWHPLGSNTLLSLVPTQFTTSSMGTQLLNGDLHRQKTLQWIHILDHAMWQGPRLQQYSHQSPKILFQAPDIVRYYRLHTTYERASPTKRLSMSWAAMMSTGMNVAI